MIIIQILKKSIVLEKIELQPIKLMKIYHKKNQKKKLKLRIEEEKLWKLVLIFLLEG